MGAQPHRFLIAEELLEIGVEADILLEPVARNSCAAIAAGCLHALARAPDAMVLSLAVDHHIPDSHAFAAAVASALAMAETGQLVTFGIRPDRPETGFGYIRQGRKLDRGHAVEAFVEKPTAREARHFVDVGYFWNSGNFLFSAKGYLAELEKHQPEVFRAVTRAYKQLRPDLDFLCLDRQALARAPSVSVDHGVMEKTDKAVVVRGDYAWSDVGTWDAVSRMIAKDPSGNALVGEAEIVDGSNNLVHSVDRLTALIGVDDMVVVSTRDCLLVTPKHRTQEVGDFVNELRRSGRLEADETWQTFRPWGNYERLDAGGGYQVKRITIKPGGVLSLQSHRKRAEHWVVVQGEVEATIDGAVRSIGAGESVHVPPGAHHRLANCGEISALIIEVQTGTYLGEDDIVRYEDDYNRVAEPA